MVLLVVTSHIISAIEAVPTSRRKDLNLPESLDVNAAISHEQLIELSRYLKSSLKGDNDEGKIPTTLNSLLRGTKVYVPPPPKKPEPVRCNPTYSSSAKLSSRPEVESTDKSYEQSPEYLAQKARLLAAVEADAYNRLITPSSRTTQPTVFSSSTPMLAALHDPSNTDAASDTLTPSLVLNIFLSVLLTGFSVYWALSKFATPDLLTAIVAGLWQSNQHPLNIRGVSEPVRVLLSLAVALIVGVAEVVIYAIYLGKVEQARTRETKLKERKMVVDSDQVGGGEQQVGDKDTDEQKDSSAPVDVSSGRQEEEKIWGRGANGGIRRRVREKWEEQEREQLGS